MLDTLKQGTQVFMDMGLSHPENHTFGKGRP